ncbi:MAG: peptide MFS transporter [Bacteroidota bacterium]|nr:peptide MFS transporter [Bacteroidota bacterium]
MSSTPKHPKGLYFLFFAEMWERFGYYLMIAIFMLYLQADNVPGGGWGMNMKDSSSLYGVFIALVFLTPFVGGLLADRKLGYRTSIIIGGLLMGTGYCLVGVHNITVFYIALGLVILGNGFFKPNISTLLGNLYNEEKYKDKKDAGYNIFYSGINIGAFICTFIAAAMRNNYGWKGAFTSAGVGMFIGVIIFIAGNKHYKHVDILKPLKPTDQSLGKIFGYTLLPSLIAALIGWQIPGNIFGKDANDAFIFACLPIIWFYFRLYKKAESAEKKPIRTMYVIFLVVIVFWAVFKQNGTALTKWMQLYTEREMPASVLPLATKLSIVDTLKATDKIRPITDEQFRLIIVPKLDPVTQKIKPDTIKGKDLPPYFKNVSADRMPKKNESVYLIPTELSQSINPGWVILLTPIVVAFFALLRRKGKEPTTPSKIGWGLLISGLSPFVMMAAVYVCHNGQEKASILWLIGTYGVVTIGELCLSPMGLSLVSKLSPARLTALMMGGWFLSTSIGNMLSGILATFWDNYDNKMLYFMVNVILLLSAAVVMFFLLKKLNQVFREYVK